jgi:hypothetical protein
MMLDLGGFAKFRRNFFFGFFPILCDDVITQVDAFITDVDGRAGDQFAYFISTLSAK